MNSRPWRWMYTGLSAAAGWISFSGLLARPLTGGRVCQGRCPASTPPGRSHKSSACAWPYIASTLPCPRRPYARRPCYGRRL
eukprot:SM002773S10254  [mRNA]  locus=s2773:1345:1587:- [translate_table: standard]